MFDTKFIIIEYTKPLQFYNGASQSDSVFEMHPI